MNKKTMMYMAEQYLDHRRSLGFKLRVEGRQVLAFAAYADKVSPQGPLTTELALKWARLPEAAASLHWARRLEVVRCFAKYLAVFEPETEIPPGKLLGTAHRRQEPYIYSEEQIRSLVQGAHSLPPRNGLRPKTYAVLFGLLACSGLRISEALKLGQEDVDLAEGLLQINESKSHKSRLVPLHPTAVTELKKYEQFRQGRFPHPKIPAFFLGERGMPLCYSTVRHTFTRLREQLGWRPLENGRHPRIHDLRHSFACRRLLQWHQNGVNVQYAISVLSTYLGHAKVSDTYWYLSATPELLGVCAGRFERFAQKGDGEPS